MMLVIGIAAAITILIILWMFTLRRIVPTNLVHIVQRGKHTVSYGVGKDGGNVYYKFPAWLPIIGVIVRELPVSNFEIQLEQYEAYDKDRVPFLLNALAFFHIADTNTAAAKVESFEHLEQQLEFVVQGAVRSIMAQHTLDEIMAERSIFGQKFTEAVNGDLKQWGVEAIKNIELMDIKDAKDSTVIKQIMAKRMSAIDAESRTEIAQNKLKAESVEAETAQQIAVKRAETAQVQGKAEAESKQVVAIAKAKADEVSGIAEQEAIARIAETEKATTEKKMEVERTRQVQTANIAKETAIIQANQQKEQMEINAQASAKQMEINAEASKKQLEITTNAQKFKIETDAEAAKIAAEKAAEARRITAEKDAEGKRVAMEKEAAGLLIKQQNEAKGKEAVGKAEAEVIKQKGLSAAESEKQMQLARVTAETTLADKIGKDPDYQKYLVNLAEVAANKEVGIEQAKQMGTALNKAELKFLINQGDVASGINGISDAFSRKGGIQINGLLEQLAQSEHGGLLVDIIEKFTKFKGDKKA